MSFRYGEQQRVYCTSSRKQQIRNVSPARVCTKLMLSAYRLRNGKVWNIRAWTGLFWLRTETRAGRGFKHSSFMQCGKCVVEYLTND
jgi:hypothetical protein